MDYELYAKFKQIYILMCLKYKYNYFNEQLIHGPCSFLGICTLILFPDYILLLNFWEGTPRAHSH